MQPSFVFSKTLPYLCTAAYTNDHSSFCFCSNYFVKVNHLSTVHLYMYFRACMFTLSILDKFLYPDKHFSDVRLLILHKKYIPTFKS